MNLTWVWEQEHAPRPAAPLDIALSALSKPGMSRAQAEASLPIADIFPRSFQPNGFSYFLASPPPPTPPEEAALHQQAAEQFVAKYGEDAASGNVTACPASKTPAGSYLRLTIASPYQAWLS
jgi:hypothetical protein